MYKRIAVFLATLLLATACSGPAAQPTPTLEKTMSTPTAHKLVLVGHRGGAGLAAENTLAAFRKGIETGIDAIELDVHLTKDGALVVMHDPDVSRTTDGTGSIGSMTLAEVKRLNAAARSTTTKEPQEVPTLNQVLTLAAANKVDVYIEVKVPPTGRYPGIEAKVAQAVRQAGLTGHVLIICFDLPTLQDIKAQDASLPTGWLMQRSGIPTEGRASPEALVGLAKKGGVDNLGLSRDYLSPEIIAAAHTQGLTVGVWTVDDPAEMRRFADWGVDAITSNRPDLLMSTFRK